MIVCPCCGFKFEGDLSHGCASCGARAVGPPLAKPVNELPSYGRSLFAGTMGGLLLVTFLISTMVALFEHAPVSFRFWSLMGAAETAAWRLKWIVLPAALITLWASYLICKSIRRNPKRFMGVRLADGGLMSAALVAVMIVTLIGITIPSRIRQSQLASDASIYAQGYTIQRALLDYRSRFGSFPSSIDDLKLLPDADGSIAAALVNLDSSAYSPGADLAAIPKKKTGNLRGTALRNISLRSTDDEPDGSYAFTKYELRLPGPDRKLGTDDDWTMHDGLIVKPVEVEDQAQVTEAASKP